MFRMIFVNLPVKSIPTSREFFTRLGFGFNPKFSDDHQTTEVLTCLSASSKEEVQELVRKALDAGGKPWKEPIAQEGMYGHSFQDPDGHVWEIMHMDPVEEQ